MYNMIFGQNPAADLLLGVLGLTKESVGRFRDVFLTEDGEIAIYTRNGGGNREQYQETLDRLSTMPGWLRDEDDDFDCTYATIYFAVPPAAVELVASLSKPTTDTPSERWAAMLEALRTGQAPEVVERMKPVMDAIMKVVEEPKT